MSETKDWRKICTDCQEGEPPEDCEYFGEPGGCNAPTMGKHPTCKESLEVGNAAKMREALKYLRDASREFCHQILNSKHNEVFDKYKHAEVSKIRDAIANANAALAEPPRNCDRFESEYDYDKLHEAFVKHCDSCNCPMGCIHRRDTRCMLDTRCGSILKCFAKFVLAEAKGGTE